MRYGTHHRTNSTEKPALLTCLQIRLAGSAVGSLEQTGGFAKIRPCGSFNVGRRRRVVYARQHLYEWQRAGKQQQ